MEKSDQSSSFSSTNTFINKHKQKIFYRSWIPGSDSYVKAVVFLLHGLGEHSGRYEHVAKLLNDNHYAVFALDHNGHGRSEGEPGYVESFESFVHDVTQFIDLINKEVFPNQLPYFILGHSMGGAIAVFASRKQAANPLFRGTVLSSPAIKKGDDVNVITVYAAKMMSRIAPRLGVKAVPPEHVSRDPSVVKAYIEDPYVYHGKVTARMGSELLRAIEWIEQNCNKVEYPFLVLQAGEDYLVHPQGAQELYDGARSTDKQIKMYPKLYHELFNEPEKWEILVEVVNWMDARVNKKEEEETKGQKHHPPVKAAL